MKIAVASGKGGTGKTTVAVNLLLSVAGLSDTKRPSRLTFLDCDVEAPNAHLFLHPRIEKEASVDILVPEIDAEKCTHCGRCAEVCVYHAIAVLGKHVLVFPQLCHGCGSCTFNCPENAIHEVAHPIGSLEWGTTFQGHAVAEFGQGTLNIGEAMATPVIRQLKKPLRLNDGLTILDAPPGNACPVVETLRGADFALLVTEPTPFGLHDLRIAVQIARDTLGLPTGVVINRDGVGNNDVAQFCAESDIPILMRIPLERRIAEAYAEGVPLIEALPEYRTRFAALYQQIAAMVRQGGQPDAQ